MTSATDLSFLTASTAVSLQRLAAVAQRNATPGDPGHQQQRRADHHQDDSGRSRNRETVEEVDAEHEETEQRNDNGGRREDDRATGRPNSLVRRRTWITTSLERLFVPVELG